MPSLAAAPATLPSFARGTKALSSTAAGTRIALLSIEPLATARNYQKLAVGVDPGDLLRVERDVIARPGKTPKLLSIPNSTGRLARHVARPLIRWRCRVEWRETRRRRLAAPLGFN
jgi:hypothetical protein